MDSAADQLLALKPEQCRQRGVGANDPIVEGYFGEAYRVEGRVEPLFRLDECGYFDIDDGEASSGDMPLLDLERAAARQPRGGVEFAASRPPLPQHFRFPPPRPRTGPGGQIGPPPRGVREC